MVTLKNFTVREIFRLENPHGKLTSKQLIDGDDVPYVAAKKTNNGIAKMCSRENIPDEVIMDGNCIVFVQQGDGSAGYATYQPGPFYATSCVCCGYIDGILNEEIGLYLVTVLDKNKALYGHSYSWSGEKLLNTKMSLPVKTVMTPDWALLETFLKDYGGAKMGKIDTSSWKKFRLSELFKKIPVEKINGKAGDFPTQPIENYEIPLLTAGPENHGFARYAKREQCPTILKNVISVSANGANTGISFYQPNEFAVLQDAYAIRLKDLDIPDESIGLFLATCLNKLLHGNFNCSNKAGWNNIKDLEISLPATATEVPDWAYMQERIVELEQERIVELEQERIAELERYLVATGLNDYTLTDEDIAVLTLFGHVFDEEVMVNA